MAVIAAAAVAAPLRGRRLSHHAARRTSPRHSRRRSPLKIETVMPRSTQKLGGKALEELLLPSCSRRDKYSRSFAGGYGDMGTDPHHILAP